MKPSLKAEFAILFGEVCKFGKDYTKIPPDRILTYEKVFSVDNFHSAYQSYDVLVMEGSRLFKYTVIYILNLTPFTHVTI